MNISTINTYRKFLLGGASALAIATTSISASAQEGDQDQSDDTGGIETIIVTATKRSANVQDIPANITAITGAAIAEMGAHNAEDYMRFFLQYHLFPLHRARMILYSAALILHLAIISVRLVLPSILMKPHLLQLVRSQMCVCSISRVLKH